MCLILQLSNYYSSPAVYKQQIQFCKSLCQSFCAGDAPVHIGVSQPNISRLIKTPVLFVVLMSSKDVFQATPIFALDTLLVKVSSWENVVCVKYPYGKTKTGRWLTSWARRESCATFARLEQIPNVVLTQAKEFDESLYFKTIYLVFYLIELQNTVTCIYSSNEIIAYITIFDEILHWIS